MIKKTAEKKKHSVSVVDNRLQLYWFWKDSAFCVKTTVTLQAVWCTWMRRRSVIFGHGCESVCTKVILGKKKTKVAAGRQCYVSFFCSILLISMLGLFKWLVTDQLTCMRCHMKAEARRTSSVLCQWALISPDGSGNHCCPLKLVSWRSFGLHELRSASARHRCPRKGQKCYTNITKPVCHRQYPSAEQDHIVSRKSIQGNKCCIKWHIWSGRDHLKELIYESFVFFFTVLGAVYFLQWTSPIQYDLLCSFSACLHALMYKKCSIFFRMSAWIYLY